MSGIIDTTPASSSITIINIAMRTTKAPLCSEDVSIFIIASVIEFLDATAVRVKYFHPTALSKIQAQNRLADLAHHIVRHSCHNLTA